MKIINNVHMFLIKIFILVSSYTFNFLIKFYIDLILLIILNFFYFIAVHVIYLI